MQQNNQAIIDLFGKDFHDAFQQQCPINEDTELFEIATPSGSNSFLYTVERKTATRFEEGYSEFGKIPRREIGVLLQWNDGEQIIGRFHYASERNTLFYSK